MFAIIFSVRSVVFASGCDIIGTVTFDAIVRLVCLQHHDVGSKQESQVCKKTAYVDIDKKEKK